MKVLVVWENPTEELIAQRVAKVAPNVLGTVANSIVAQLNVHRVPISARALGFRELFSAAHLDPEKNAYVQALERAVFGDAP